MVADAAAGSRYYVMEKSVDAGKTWERMDGGPFGGQIGVTEGLVFFDEQFGVIGLTGASQSGSALYATRDGGLSFEKIEFPMSAVIEMPAVAEEYGIYGGRLRLFPYAAERWRYIEGNGYNRGE